MLSLWAMTKTFKRKEERNSHKHKRLLPHSGSSRICSSVCSWAAYVPQRGDARKGTLLRFAARQNLLSYKGAVVLCRSVGPSVRPSVRVRVSAASYPARVLQRRYAWRNAKAVSAAQRLSKFTLIQEVSSFHALSKSFHSICSFFY